MLLPMEVDKDESNDKDWDVEFSTICEQATLLWMQLNDEQRGWWSDRADMVNSRHIPGIVNYLTCWITTPDNIKKIHSIRFYLLIMENSSKHDCAEQKIGPK